MTATITKVETKAGNTTYTVSINGRVVGLLTKYADTKTTTNPWKAYKGMGAAATMIGAFFKADGGKEAAVAAILG